MSISAFGRFALFTHLLAPLRRSRAVSAVLLAAILAAGVLVGVFAGSATASRQLRPAAAVPPAVPTRADQIQNIDQVRAAIKAYYGDTVTTTPDPVDGSTVLHEPSRTGNYAREVRHLEKYASAYLDYEAYGRNHPARKPAILLDVDDTSLVTYDYEIYSNFAYNPTTNAAFVNSATFPKVFGMPRLVRNAVKDGYTIFFLTGRPETQRDGTVTNLAKAGFPSVPSDHLFLKDLTNPIYKSCYVALPTPTNPTCTTSQYKSLTRKYIQTQGYRIFANFGDQFSDLSGGYAKKAFKLPNPMYYLP